MADDSSSAPKRVTTPTKGNSRTPKEFQLTEEEKAVLLDCRAKSISRGLPLGIGGVLGLRFLLRLNRLPPFVQRNKPLFYIGVFIGCFTSGVSSYKTTCMEKIMSLENSRLADQLRETLKRDNIAIPDKWKQPEHHDKPMGRRPRPDIVLDDDKQQKDFAIDVHQENDSTAPDAFGQSQGVGNDTTSSSLYGKTFDEIREENRKKQLNQSYNRSRRTRSREDQGDEPPVGGQPDSTGGGKPRAVKRNKYGDIIYEDD